MSNKTLLIFIILQISLISNGCITSPLKTVDIIDLPRLKNSASECYYLDEFMPTPDSMVAGRFGNLKLRYYTYKKSNYIDWKESHIVLSFYSQDEHCWSLFEETRISH